MSDLFHHAYQPIGSVEEGVTRADDLAKLIGRIWVQRHPKRSTLTDALSQ